jgi:hypothetical protein
VRSCGTNCDLRCGPLHYGLLAAAGKSDAALIFANICRRRCESGLWPVPILTLMNNGDADMPGVGVAPACDGTTAQAGDVVPRPPNSDVEADVALAALGTTQLNASRYADGRKRR